MSVVWGHLTFILIMSCYCDHLGAWICVLRHRCLVHTVYKERGVIVLIRDPNLYLCLLCKQQVNIREIGQQKNVSFQKIILIFRCTTAEGKWTNHSLISRLWDSWIPLHFYHLFMCVWFHIRVSIQPYNHFCANNVSYTLLSFSVLQGYRVRIYTWMKWSTWG